MVWQGGGGKGIIKPPPVNVRVALHKMKAVLHLRREGGLDLNVEGQL